VPTTAISLRCSSIEPIASLLVRTPASGFFQRQSAASCWLLACTFTHPLSVDCRPGDRAASTVLRARRLAAAKAFLQLCSGSLSSPLQQLKPQEHQQRRLRLTEMCDNHAMFQFLFDPQGVLLAANKRALNNMRGEDS